jgi:hypothetical protein
MINVFRSLLALSRFFKFHDGWDNLKSGLITTNKGLAQNLVAAVENNPDLRLEPFLLLIIRQHWMRGS